MPQTASSPPGAYDRPRRLANSPAVVRIVSYPAFQLPDTALVPSSHWLDASGTKGDTWDRGKQIPSMFHATIHGSDSH